MRVRPVGFDDFSKARSFIDLLDDLTRQSANETLVGGENKPGFVIGPDAVLVLKVDQA